MYPPPRGVLRGAQLEDRWNNRKVRMCDILKQVSISYLDKSLENFGDNFIEIDPNLYEKKAIIIISISA